MGRSKNASGVSARPIQVGEQIRQVISEMILDETINDPRLKKASLVTVTEVRMTRDLQLGRVLVSVFPEDDDVVAAVFEGLASARSEIKRELGRRLHLRFTPELRFLVDDSTVYGAHIESILREINAGVSDDSNE